MNLVLLIIIFTTSVNAKVGSKHFATKNILSSAWNPQTVFKEYNTEDLCRFACVQNGTDCQAFHLNPSAGCEFGVIDDDPAYLHPNHGLKVHIDSDLQGDSISLTKTIWQLQ